MRKHLYTNDFKEVYKSITKFIPFKPLKLIILGYLIEIEDIYIEYRAKLAVTTSINSYLNDTHSEVDSFEGVMVDELHIVSRWTIDKESE